MKLTAAVSLCKALLHPAARNRRWVARSALSVLRAAVFGGETIALDGRPFAYLDLEGVLGLLGEIGLVDLYGVAPRGAGLIVDCGSNIGLAALYLARRSPAARLLCFEPSAAAFAVLQRNLAGLGERARSFNVALGDGEGPVDLYRDEGFSLNMRLGSPSPTSSREPVRLVRLSGYLEEPVDLLKIDVEGSEMGILADLERSGKLRLVRNLVLEADWNQPEQSHQLSELLSLLERNAFRYNLKAGGSYWVPSRIGEYQTIIVYATQRNPAAA